MAARFASLSTSAGSMTSSSRCCSHSGRSHRIGMGIAPAFHAASAATTSSIELGIDSATIAPWVTADDCSARAHRLAARSRPAQVSAVSAPSLATTMSAVPFGSAVARTVSWEP